MAGLLPLRLLAERGGLTAGVSAAMRRPDHNPVYDRGQVLVDLGLVLLAGGQTIGDFQALAHLEKLIGPVTSTPTVWRALNEADGLQVARIHQATCRFRRVWWGMLAARPEGFPWLKVAGRELTGITVVDLDASVVQAGSDTMENARPTYKGGVDFVPNMAVIDNVDDVVVIDPRPGQRHLQRRRRQHRPLERRSRGDPRHLPAQGPGASGRGRVLPQAPGAHRRRWGQEPPLAG